MKFTFGVKMKNIHKMWGVAVLIALFSLMSSVSACYGSYCYVRETSYPNYYQYERVTYQPPEPSFGIHVWWNTYYPNYGYYNYPAYTYYPRYYYPAYRVSYGPPVYYY